MRLELLNWTFNLNFDIISKQIVSFFIFILQLFRIKKLTLNNTTFMSIINKWQLLLLMTLRLRLGMIDELMFTAKKERKGVWTRRVFRVKFQGIFVFEYFRIGSRCSTATANSSQVGAMSADFSRWDEWAQALARQEELLLL